jgi:hypothetical protein
MRKNTPVTFFYCLKTKKVRSRAQDCKDSFMVIDENCQLNEDDETGNKEFVQSSIDAERFAANMGWNRARQLGGNA